ncbi:MAG: phage tail protein [Devosiaceae bacterium]|nr:phage tail protein [Devosiaceae bacterium]
MAGPIIASLGPFAFEAHGFGLSEVGRSLKTPWATVKVPGGFDKLQWLGGDSESVKISGVLFPNEFGGLASLAGIKAAAEAGVPLHFIQKINFSTANILSRFVVEGVEDSQTFIASNGVAMKNTYSLSLRRYQAGAFSFQSVVGLF